MAQHVGSIKKTALSTILSAGLDKINGTLSILAIVLLVFISLSVTSEVLLRYFFGYSLIWVVEISEYILLWITFLAAGWVLKREGHVRMDLVLNLLSPRAKVCVNMITSIMGAGVCLTLSWFSAEVTWDHYLRGAAEQSMLELPKAPIMAIIPLGSFLLFLQFVSRFLNIKKTGVDAVSDEYN